MNLIEFIKSRIFFIMMNVLLYFTVLIIMSIAHMPLVVLFLIFLIWFLPLTVYMICQYLHGRKFFKDMTAISSKLDKKYLLSEVIKKPYHYEEIIFYDILCEACRNMHEEVNVYKNMHDEYREYIETWVHEIKTPLASVELMLENSEIEEKKNIIDETMKIGKYINQALYYCRSNSVSNDYIIKEFNLGDIVRECIRENRRDCINKKISVELHEIDVNVTCDEKWIKFIINQIIINAIKYRKEDNSKILFYTEKNHNNKYVLHIKDNGVGIPKCDINRVFDKGFTGENGRKFGKSTGIGLYLCKKLCTKLNINIYLKSQKDIETDMMIEF